MKETENRSIVALALAAMVYFHSYTVNGLGLTVNGRAANVYGFPMIGTEINDHYGSTECCLKITDFFFFFFFFFFAHRDLS